MKYDFNFYFNKIGFCWVINRWWNLSVYFKYVSMFRIFKVLMIFNIINICY